ncbi:uncharacterized protein LOC122078094 [Macadamia integrifolia]|uniref:uncharacterized protein LOC122078094 n=1 Tax=Macadamia integrifolia TaxID=60698 RepID=UPI001C4F94FC|nr:uncharacterized protein LOC122078094 [Macadamia integrifolia]
MDREPEELQFLGLFGIYKESFKIILSWRKIFNKITLALILPLTFIFLAHIQISELIMSKLMQNEEALNFTRPNTPTSQRLSDRISSEWVAYWLFKAAYLVVLLIFSLLSTSAVVYSIASIYTAKDLTFKKIMTVVPKVWKRLMVTFLWSFVIVFLYNIVAVVCFVISIIAVNPGTTAGTVLLTVLAILYFCGVVYISIVWHLASVISVLEDFKGINAMTKSKALIKGKMKVAFVIFVMLIIAFILIQFGFEKMVVHGERFGMWSRVFSGIVCFLLLMQLFLFGLVVQTVFYFVCKSYHHESIDKSLLADHLEVYAGEYVPLRGKDIQLEQYEV